MGRLVHLWKVEETEESVSYAYGENRAAAGSFRLNKLSGAVSDQLAVSGVSAEESWNLYGMLAKLKAEKMFAEKVYPNEAYLAL